MSPIRQALAVLTAATTAGLGVAVAAPAAAQSDPPNCQRVPRDGGETIVCVSGIPEGTTLEGSGGVDDIYITNVVNPADAAQPVVGGNAVDGTVKATGGTVTIVGGPGGGTTPGGAGVSATGRVTTLAMLTNPVPTVSINVSGGAGPSGGNGVDGGIDPDDPATSTTDRGTFLVTVTGGAGRTGQGGAGIGPAGQVVGRLAGGSVTATGGVGLPGGDGIAGRVRDMTTTGGHGGAGLTGAAGGAGLTGVAEGPLTVAITAVGGTGGAAGSAPGSTAGAGGPGIGPAGQINPGVPTASPGLVPATMTARGGQGGTASGAGRTAGAGGVGNAGTVNGTGRAETVEALGGSGGVAPSGAARGTRGAGNTGTIRAEGGVDDITAAGGETGRGALVANATDALIDGGAPEPPGPDDICTLRGDDNGAVTRCRVVQAP